MDKPRVLKTIDLTPTWAALMPALITILRENRVPDAIRTVTEELTKLAQFADRVNAERKEQAE